MFFLQPTLKVFHRPLQIPRLNHPHCTVTMLQRSLQPPDKAFHTEMPDLIPYFIVALNGYKRKDDLYALAIEIRNV
ncbi:hypothetical protein FOTG_15698 [Fusarium oxysporum f. sp. vasinfectum 25433]|uniref:Uncharacterized protein n=1 Tax=Fusarium oxysporum f. sp. vasinfectum 25433 TaxID=1089449 RepID=X0KQY1_FUSOX|nr:hypothetical protein FOTG_15698 [Fusarium oxysporum f. sp. vasinfectum 25433]